jgi:hypothetical protein
VVELHAGAAGGYHDERLLRGEGNTQVLPVAHDPPLQFLRLGVELALLVLPTKHQEVVVAIELEQDGGERMAELRATGAVQQQVLNGKKLSLGLHGHLRGQAVDDPAWLLQKALYIDVCGQGTSVRST